MTKIVVLGVTLGEKSPIYPQWKFSLKLVSRQFKLIRVL